MADRSMNSPLNPFDNAFELLGHAPLASTECIHAAELEQLVAALTTRAKGHGRIVLLRSPRAGFGKTHLLIRLNERVVGTHDFVSLEPSKGRYLNDELVMDAVLRRFTRLLPGRGGLTHLDDLARRVLAKGLEPLVLSGEVPSQDKESALKAIRQRPEETFDFHDPEASTAQWALTNFSLLGPRLATELAGQVEARYRPVAWWVELLFRYSSAPLDHSNRNGSLFETVFGGEHLEADMHEKLVTLLNLLGLVTSPVLVLDEVEGLSSSPESGLEIVTFLNALHQSCSKLVLIISVNGDVWQSAFLPRMPCGLKDRLTDIVVDLKPISRDQAMTLLRDRAGDRAELIAESLDLENGVVYPRGIVRSASSVWSEITTQDDVATSAEAVSDADLPEYKDRQEQQLASGISEMVPSEVESSAEELPDPEISEPAAENIISAEKLMPQITEDDSHEMVEDHLEEDQDDIAKEEPVFPPPPTREKISDAPFKPLCAIDEDQLAGGASDLTEDVLAADQEMPDSPDQESAPSPFSQADESVNDVSDVDSSPFAKTDESSDLAEVEELESPFSKVDEDGDKADESEFDPATEGMASPFAMAASSDEADETDESKDEEEVDEPSEAAVPRLLKLLKSPFASNDDSDPTTDEPEQDPAKGDETEQDKAGQDEAEESEESEESEEGVLVKDAAISNPFDVDDEVEAHTVTHEDHERVEDLLRQFRDRYGRE